MLESLVLVAENSSSKFLYKELKQISLIYLVQKGISISRLSYKGYGDSKPIVDNSSEEGRKQNRRVEITVLEK
ncbi:MAG: OmpA family protein [Bacteroidales bacterium]|nr:OmpA family protein [Bacteroidales bacterium]